MQAESIVTTASVQGIRKLGGHSLVYAASSFLGQLGALLTFPLYTRTLGVEAYGVLALALSASGVLRTLVIAGTNTALMNGRIGASDDEVPVVTGAAFLYVGCASALLVAISALLFPLLSASVFPSAGHALLVSVGLFIAADSLYELLLATARAEGRPVDYAYSNAIRVAATFTVAVVLLVVLDAGPAGAIVGMMAGCVAAGSWLAFRLRLRLSMSGALPWVPKLLRQGAPLLPANLASWIANLSDRYLLLMLLGSTATVGLYSAGYRIGSLITVLFVGPFHTAFLPLMLRHLESSEGAETYKESSRLFLVFGCVAVCVLQIFAMPGVLILAGAEYIGAERIVGAVALGCLLSGAAMLMTPSAMKAGRSIHLAMAYGAGAGVNVACNLVLIPLVGMVGAATATVAGYAVVLAIMLGLSGRESRPPDFDASLAKALPIMVLATVPTLINYGSPARQSVVAVALSICALYALHASGVMSRSDATMAVRSVSLLAHGVASRVLPRDGRVGAPVRRSVKAALRLPMAMSLIMQVHGRRFRRAHERVGGSPGFGGPYLQYLVENPEAMRTATAGAERIVDGEMITFGHKWSWESHNDWHLDPISRRRWRRIPSGLIDVNFVRDDSDVQCVWETSRLEHVWRVALAFAQTKDERYGAWVVQALDSWRRSNPAGWGVNWTVPMEVAMRGVAIAEIRAAVRAAHAWSDAVDRRVCEMLADHAEWVLGNLEWRGKYTQNHYLASLVGVTAIAHHLPDWERLQGEAVHAHRQLFDCIKEQVFDDGANFENSLGYHLLVLELGAYGVGLCCAAGIIVPAIVEDRLRKMVDFALVMRFSDDMPVAFGDDDDDFLLPSAGGHFDSRRPCTFERIRHACSVIGLGSPHDIHQAELPRSFDDAQVYVIGDSRMKAFLNLMPTGVRGTGPHRHNDALSFCLEFNGAALLVDPGTFRYQSSGDDRNRYRSVTAHNTLQVDGLEQNDLVGLFALQSDRIHIHQLDRYLSPQLQCIRASHAAFAESANIHHVRSWEYVAETEVLVVIDSFCPESPDSGCHRFVARFHFAPGVTPAAPDFDSQDRFSVRCGDCMLAFVVGNGTDVDASVSDSLYSPHYRLEIPARLLEVAWTGGSDSTLTTTIGAQGDVIQ